MGERARCRWTPHRSREKKLLARLRDHARKKLLRELGRHDRWESWPALWQYVEQERWVDNSQIVLGENDE